MYIVTTQQGDQIPLLVYCVSPKGVEVRGAGDEVPCREREGVPRILFSRGPQARTEKYEWMSEP